MTEVDEQAGELEVGATPVAKERNKRPLLIGGIIAASVLAAGLLFGGGVFVGSHLPRFGGPEITQGQLQGSPGGFAGPQQGGPHHGGPQQGGPRGDQRGGPQQPDDAPGDESTTSP